MICAQDDALGLPSVATCQAAFEAAGIKRLDEPLLFGLQGTDFAPVVTRLFALCCLQWRFNLPRQGPCDKGDLAASRNRISAVHKGGHSAFALAEVRTRG